MQKQSSLRTTLILIFGLSGFSGLIYESIWSHYLKLFLGHSAYAQTVVLAIFMGGMALGSAWCGRKSEGWGNLLRAYAVAEAIVGLTSLAFHPLFRGFLEFSYETVFPALPGPAWISAYKWTLGALLVLPQSVLLGMTFPLMASGILRRVPDGSGSTLSLLYFSNSFGAVFGVLASGFVLIRWVGLPGTLLVAGLINLGLASVVWMLAGPGTVRVPPAGGERRDNRALPLMFLGVAFATGLSSFIYEIGWIRMLSLVLGTSTHAFELMLASFILGLALGALWVRRRIDRLGDPMRFLATMQILMGLAAVVTLPLYGRSFHFMAWLMKSVEKIDGGYTLFTVASSGIAAAIMLPACFFAGTTLPLITHILLKRGSGERSIGAVYASNTLGGILGVVLAVHLGFSLLGLKGMIAVGALLDLGIGVMLLRHAGLLGTRAGLMPAVATGLILLVLIGVPLDPLLMTSAVYREGALPTEETEILFNRDGKTASVAITENASGVRSIRTNGKPDASLGHAMQGPAPDEFTMISLGVLPFLYRPSADRVANIGFGSGLTTAVLLDHPSVSSVDSIEIEPQMVRAARLFGETVAIAYSDPRHQIYIDDARTHFAVQQKTYDVIVSEPSNPWVSGVSGLFTREYYEHVSQFLDSNGILVQWLQVYEINEELISSVFSALATSFSQYDVYAPNFGDLVIVASISELGSPIWPEALVHPALAARRSRIGLTSPSELQYRYVGDERTFSPLWREIGSPANSDYHPFLDQRAAESRFLHQDATEFTRLRMSMLPIIDLFESRALELEFPAAVESQEASQSGAIAATLLRYWKGGEWSWPPSAAKEPDNIRRNAEPLRVLLDDCETPTDPNVLWGSLFNSLAKRVVPFSHPDHLAPIWSALEAPTCWARFDPLQMEFIRLLISVASRDSASAQTHALRVLDSHPGFLPNEQLHDYVVSAALVHLAADPNPDLFARIAPRIRSEFEEVLVQRLLMAHVRAALEASRAVSLRETTRHSDPPGGSVPARP